MSLMFESHPDNGDQNYNNTIGLIYMENMLLSKFCQT